MIEFVKRKKLKYRNGSRQEKAALAEEVLKYVLSKGGRFLKRSGNPDDPNWYIASTADGYRKICHCLRDGEKHRKNHLNTVSIPEPLHIPQLASEPSPAGEGMIMSVSALYNKWKDANRTNIQGLVPSFDSALVRADEDEDIFADAPEEPFVALASGSVSAPNLPRTQMDILLGTAMGLYQEAMPLREPKGLAPIRIPTPSSNILRKSLPTKLALEIFEKQNAAVPKEPLKQGLAIPLKKHPTYLTPSLDLVAITPKPSLSIESEESYGIMVADPSSSDILFGEDPTFYYHPGNVQLRKLIDASVGCIPLSVDNKVELSRRIVSETIKCGARFLTRQTFKGAWYRIREEEACALIMRCLDAEVSKKSARLVPDRDCKLQSSPLSGSPSMVSISLKQLECEQPHESPLRHQDGADEARELSQAPNDRKIMV